MNEQFNLKVIPDFVLNEKVIVSLIEGYKGKVIHLEALECETLQSLPEDHPENVFAQEAYHDYVIGDATNHHLVSIKEVLTSFENEDNKYCENCFLAASVTFNFELVSVTSNHKTFTSTRTLKLGNFLKSLTLIYSFLNTETLPADAKFINVWAEARKLSLFSSFFKNLQETVSLKISALLYNTDKSYSKHVEKINNFLLQQNGSLNKLTETNFVVFNSEFFNEEYILNLLFLDDYDDIFESILFYPGFKAAFAVSLPETFFMVLKSLLLKSHNFFSFLITEGDLLNENEIVVTSSAPSFTVLDTMEKLFDKHNSSLRKYEDLFLIANNI